MMSKINSHLQKVYFLGSNCLWSANITQDRKQQTKDICSRVEFMYSLLPSLAPQYNNVTVSHRVVFIDFSEGTIKLNRSKYIAGCDPYDNTNNSTVQIIGQHVPLL